MENKKQNIFVTFLELLKVKHTKSFSTKFYNEHPYKYSLYGLSKMLSDYNIENMGLKLDNERFQLLETPFIVHLNNHFAIVKEINQDKIDCILRDQDVTFTIDEFKERWTGAVLLAEPDETSIEPAFHNNRKKELFIKIQTWLLLLLFSLFFIFYSVTYNVFQNIGVLLLLIFNIIGTYVCWMLINKQLHFKNSYADKICSLFKKGDCNNILESSAAKFMGLIGWSEIGFSYFISNIMVLVLVPDLMPYAAIINVCSLPYSVWSIWYQSQKAKQWCTLCLIVQVLLWALFIVNFLLGYISIPPFHVVDIFLIGFIYLTPLLLINTIISTFINSMGNEYALQELNSLKMKDDIFISLLNQQPYYETKKSVSHILWGNIDSDILVTILTNPHCDPCSKLHIEIQRDLKHFEHKLCIQYVFSSFSEELNRSNKILISAYQNKENWAEIYDEWYKWGKNQVEHFQKKYDIMINSYVEDEFNRHEKWIEETKLHSTPTILVNGYELPESYKIGDLKYFTELLTQK